MEANLNLIFEGAALKREDCNLISGENYVPVAYGVDSNFLMHAGVSILSFVKNSFGLRLHFIVITSSYNKLELSKLSTLVDCTSHALTIIVISDDVFAHLPSTKTFPVSVYFRLLIPIVFKEYSFILYVDADIVALNSVQELLQQNLPVNVACCVVKEPCEQRKLSMPIGINDGDYFNSGMLYINTKIWNENNISQKTFQCLLESGDRFKFFDQDALNIVLHRNVMFLSDKYNKQIKVGHTKLDMSIFPDNDTVLLHYVGKNKPWQIWNQQPISSYYNYYLSLSPWHDIIFVRPIIVNDMKKYYKMLWLKKLYGDSILWFLRYLFVLIVEKLKLKINCFISALSHFEKLQGSLKV